MVNRFINLLIGTLFSIVIFFAVSFITFLTQIGPIHYQGRAPYKMDIGFPFTFYEQFWMRGSDFPNSGWHIDNLFYDCLIIWIVVTGAYVIIQKYKK
jgi:hypothetical protein